jgi:hypothetical protein
MCYHISFMNYRILATVLVILCAFSRHSAFAGQWSSCLCLGNKITKEAANGIPRAFGLLHSDEVKSICKFLDQKDINQFLRSSKRCNADVRGENLTLFTEGRKDTLTLGTFEKLNTFLEYATDHLYMIKLHVSIRSEEELRRLLSHSRLHNNLSELTLEYVEPFEGTTNIGENSVRIDLVGMLTPFRNLKSVIVFGVKSVIVFGVKSVIVFGVNNDEPTEAFTLIDNKNVEALKVLIMREPRHLMIKSIRRTSLAHAAAKAGELETVQFLNEIAPHMMKEKDTTGLTPICTAVVYGHLPVVQFLTKSVPNSMGEKTNELWTPVRMAAHLKKWDILKFLAEHDTSSLSIKNKDGRNALDFAICSGASPELMQELKTLVIAAQAILEE